MCGVLEGACGHLGDAAVQAPVQRHTEGLQLGHGAPEKQSDLPPLRDLPPVVYTVLPPQRRVELRQQKGGAQVGTKWVSSTHFADGVPVKPFRPPKYGAVLSLGK